MPTLGKTVRLKAIKSPIQARKEKLKVTKSLKITIGVVIGIVVISISLMAGLLVAHAAQGGFLSAITQILGRASNPGLRGGQMMGYYGQGGTWGSSNSAHDDSPFGPTLNVAPLTIAEARQAATNYLEQLGDANLKIEEIMVFTNNAYVRVTETNTGIGAMELLVDPSNRSVFPEYGPNMMWNLKYSPMYGSRFGNFGGMMSFYHSGIMSGYTNSSAWGASHARQDNSDDSPISPEKAVSLAQQYLNSRYPDYQADSSPDQFYGYYTLEILKDGNPAGMLSVNGSTGQVFLHTWHGRFITSWED